MEGDNDMSDTKNTDAPVLPWVRTFGAWVFAYTGGSSVRIRPVGSEPDGWTNSIGLDSYGMKPDTITTAWLRARAREWVADYDADVAAGNI